MRTPIGVIKASVKGIRFAFMGVYDELDALKKEIEELKGSSKRKYNKKQNEENE